MTTEDYVRFYGENWRKLIESAMKFLDENESLWDLKEPINRSDYIEDLIVNADKRKLYT